MLDLDRHGATPQPDPLRPHRVSWEEFHDAWDNERRTEWVDGEIIEVSPENIRHGLVTGFLFELFRHAVRSGRPGVVLFTNILVRLSRRPSGRLPDVAYVANEHLDRLKETFIDGAPDLIVEIVSPRSDRRDHQDKLAEYEAEGVPEYWIIDEPRKEALFYVLDADGKYQLIATDEDGVYTSTVLPNLRVRVSWFWQWPLPDLDVALADLPA
jgi:Uma2 family endonuclease